VNRYYFVVMMLMLVAGQRVIAGDVTKTRLDACVSYYQDGDYQKAVDSIKTLLPLISDRREEAEAYKYLGFSYVMLDLIDKAKEFFRVALEKFPQMVIDTLEVPPNITIVFKQAKLETQLEKGEMFDKTVQDKNQKRIVLGALCTSTGVIGTGVGGYFLYRGFKARRDYKNATADFDSYWNTMKRSFLIGGCATAVGGLDLTLGLYLLIKKPAQQKKVSMTTTGNGITLQWRF
jgi:tetratricopeptide (TPR) repeat protein